MMNLHFFYGHMPREHKNFNPLPTNQLSLAHSKKSMVAIVFFKGTRFYCVA